MPELKQINKDSELHWFWRLTTKWWFFPVFYTLFAMINAIIFAIKGQLTLSKGFSESFIPSLFLAPNGILYFLLLPAWLFIYDKQPLDPGLGFLSFPIAFIVDLFITFSIILIQYYFITKNKVLKAMIITNGLLFIISYLGIMLNFVFPIKYRYL